MSADREPTAVEVIAEAVDAHDWMQPRGYAWPVCACGREFRGGSDEAAEHQASKVLAALRAAGFVVATRDEIRAMTPQEQAELVGGHICCRRSRRSQWSRAVGPWVTEVQP